MNEIILAGCTPTPLANYLKALGVFRLVAEQADPEAKARWQGERFVLTTRLSREELARFFLEEYRPTPILAPWNGGSGFYPSDNKDGFGPLSSARAPRFQPFSSAIATAAAVLAGLGLTEKPDADSKPRLLMHLRAQADELFLSWLDAAVVLAGGNPAYPPLLGTGGNDGRLDFTNNFMQRLVELFDPNTGEAVGMAGGWLDNALFAGHTPRLAQNAIGQFAPGQIGGANATTGFATDSRINAWDFVLMLEGALMFVTATTRRLESSHQATLAYPFTVHPSHGGSGGTTPIDATTGKSRGEIWLPLWGRLATLPEISSLFSEGRVTVGRRAARDGLDFARAVGQLGTDRGIAAFQRYGFMVRNGLAYLATPLGRVEASRAPNVDLIADLEQGQFLDRLRREARDKDASASLKRAVSQLENALFALTQPGSGRPTIQRALILLGEVMQILAVSRKGREAVPVLPHLSAAWVIQAADDSAEFHLALAVAALTGLRSYLAPVAWDKGRWQWAPESRLHVWGKGELARNLVRVVERRVIESQRNLQLEPFRSNPRLGARLSDIHAFLTGQTDDGLIAALLHGLIWAELPDELLPSHAVVEGAPSAIPLAYALCKSFFTAPSLLKYLRRLPEDARCSLPGELPRLLAANQVDKALPLAWRRGRIAGLGWPRGDAPQTTFMDGPRLLAALAVPLQSAALLQLLPRAEDLQSEPV
ncbi:MAG: type I-U CRISPR-associated protein Csx17 [Pseudomonadota bacterium]|nr:type I-U CRISPR-associated protein Csx17 [Pseudomonadota bacterium]